MEYYIISLFISIIIFIFTYEKNGTDDNNEPTTTSILSTKNILLFFIIYIVTTILSFYIFTASLSISSLCPMFLLNLLTISSSPSIDNSNIQNYKELYNDEIDPKLLSKINDNIDIGFTPTYENENENE
jgi:hypothetical protein